MFRMVVGLCLLLASINPLLANPREVPDPVSDVNLTGRPGEPAVPPEANAHARPAPSSRLEPVVAKTVLGTLSAALGWGVAAIVTRGRPSMALALPLMAAFGSGAHIVYQVASGRPLDVPSAVIAGCVGSLGAGIGIARNSAALTVGLPAIAHAATAALLGR